MNLWNGLISPARLNVTGNSDSGQEWPPGAEGWSWSAAGQRADLNWPLRTRKSHISEKGSFRFPGKEKLKSREEIREVFNSKNYYCDGARLFCRRNGLSYNRIAFTFTRKFGNAVKRNHSRRLSRESYRILRNFLLKGYDLVLLVYTDDMDYKTRVNQLKELFSRAGLMESNKGIQESI